MSFTLPTLTRRSLLVLLFVMVASVAVPHTVSAATMPITGWAWSSGLTSPFMGWISFSCTSSGTSCATGNYGVLEDTTMGTLTGYAWSYSWTNGRDTLPTSGLGAI